MNECCQNPDNQREGSGPRGGETPEGVTVTHCAVCGCRHYEAELDPGQLGVTGTGL